MNGIRSRVPRAEPLRGRSAPFFGVPPRCRKDFSPIPLLLPFKAELAHLPGIYPNKLLKFICLDSWGTRLLLRSKPAAMPRVGQFRHTAVIGKLQVVRTHIEEA